MYIYNSLSNYTISLFKYIKNKTQTFEFEFFVLMLGIVKNPASVVPPDRHQRSPSPEYWLLSPNSISHHPVPGLWLLVHLMLIYGTTYATLAHTLIVKSYIAPADISERSQFSLFDHCDLTLDCFSCFGLISACLDTLLLSLLWYPRYRYRPLPVWLCNSY